MAQVSVRGVSLGEDFIYRGLVVEFHAEIGYTIPKRITRKMGMSTVRFYVQGVNLLTFSKFKLWDPELNASYGNIYPQMRTVCFGANVNF